VRGEEDTKSDKLNLVVAVLFFWCLFGVYRSPKVSPQQRQGRKERNWRKLRNA
jgi:hypothetical protein